MVMPRSASSASSSVVVVPISTSPARCLAPLANSIRSVTVVLPASIWAMMPILRIRSSGVDISISAHKKRREARRPAACCYWLLPREMRKRLVGVGHAVDVFTTAHGRAFAVEGSDEFVGQLLRSRAAFLLADRHQEP